MKDFFQNVSAESEDAVGDDTAVVEVPEQLPLGDSSAVATGLSQQEHVESLANGEAVQEISDDYEVLSDVADQVEAIQEAQGGLSVESLLYASVMVDHAARRLGLPGQQLKYPSLESVKLDDRVQVSTEQLNLSVEGVFTAIKAVLKHQVSAAVRAWSFATTRINSTTKKMESLRSLAMDLGDQQNTDKINVNITRLHKDGRTPTDLVKHVGEFYEVVGKLVKGFHPKAVANYTEFVRVSKNIPLKSPEDFESGYKKLADSMKDARDVFSESQLKATYPGGLRLFEDRKSQYKGDNPSAKKMDEFATKNLPVRAGFRSPGDSGVSGFAQIKPLTRQEILTTTKQALDALRDVSKMATAVSNFQNGLTTLIPNPSWIMFSAGMFGVGATAATVIGHTVEATAGPNKAAKTTRQSRRGNRAELKALNNAYRTLHNLALYVSVDAAGSLATVSGAMVPVLRASIKSYK